MKKTYIKADVELISFEGENVIATSTKCQGHVTRVDVQTSISEVCQSRWTVTTDSMTT